jgi:FLVCR family feline leukemia virus subgroup C receptor-related protein
MAKNKLQVNFPEDVKELSKGTTANHHNQHLHLSIINDPSPVANTKVYRRRWLMLFIFVLVFMTNAFQWIQFSIINNLIMK